MAASSLVSLGWGLSDVALLLIVCFGVTLVFTLVQLIKIASYAALPGVYLTACHCGLHVSVLLTPL
jgi:hypothetical protein